MITLHLRAGMLIKLVREMLEHFPDFLSLIIVFHMQVSFQEIFFC